MQNGLPNSLFKINTFFFSVLHIMELQRLVLKSNYLCFSLLYMLTDGISLGFGLFRQNKAFKVVNLDSGTFTRHFINKMINQENNLQINW